MHSHSETILADFVLDKNILNLLQQINHDLANGVNDYKNYNLFVMYRKKIYEAILFSLIEEQFFYQQVPTVLKSYYPLVIQKLEKYQSCIEELEYLNNLIMHHAKDKDPSNKDSGAFYQCSQSQFFRIMEQIDNFNGNKFKDGIKKYLESIDEKVVTEKEYNCRFFRPRINSKDKKIVIEAQVIPQNFLNNV